MTFSPEFGADKSISSDNRFSPLISWIHNDSMYVRFGGMRNSKAWCKSKFMES